MKTREGDLPWLDVDESDPNALFTPSEQYGACPVRVAKFARFISARAKIHVQNTRGEQGRKTRTISSVRARIYAALDGIDIAWNDGVP